MKSSKSNKLVKQILKFGVVGGLSFLIDFIIYTIAIKVMANDSLPFKAMVSDGMDVVIAGTLGFMISLIFNYFASMAFVFERKENTSKKKEFVIFLVLSVIGLLLNNVLLWFYASVLNAEGNVVYALHNNVYNFIAGMGITFFASTEEFIKILAKVFATAIVMIYNFVSRKMTLEKKEEVKEN